MSAETIKSEDFVRGRFVRVPDDKLKLFVDASAKKLRGRIGVVIGRAPDGPLVVQFPQIGHRLAFSQRFSSPERTLEVLTDQREIMAFRDEVLENEKRRLARTRQAA